MTPRWFPALPSFLLCLSSASASASAGEPESTGCRAVELARDNRETPALEFPNGAIIDWASAFEARLAGELTRDGRFRVIDSGQRKESLETGSKKRESRGAMRSALQWQSSQNASVRLSLRFPEVSFRTGSRGERMLYGWTSRMQPASEPNPFRDPLTDFGDAPFAPRDPGILGTYAGLDLGEGLSLDLIFAWLRIRLSRYDARIALDLEADVVAADERFELPVRTRARGFFFDVAGGYLEYTAGLEASRTDAMKRALDRAVAEAASTIGERFAEVPRAARVDGWTLSSNGVAREILLATASGCPLPENLILADEQSGLVMRVRESHENGGIAEIVEGKPESLSVGAFVVEGGAGASKGASPPGGDGVAPAPFARSASGIHLGSAGGMREAPQDLIPRPDSALELAGVQEKSDWQLALERLAGTALLPYRIYRYFAHDQSYHRRPDPVIAPSKPWASLENWSAHAKASPWGRSLGLSVTPDRSEGVVVAVIDTGVDYNHPVIHDRVWLNPDPRPDSFGELDRYGWDFISADRRADDDHDRGTELASLILAVAPRSTIMPIKAFNPWGVTRADILAASIRYAVRNRARLVLAAWEAELRSSDLEAALNEAAMAGVEVITRNDPRLQRIDDTEFDVLRPRLRRGKARGPSPRAAVLTGWLARQGS